MYRSLFVSYVISSVVALTSKIFKSAAPALSQASLAAEANGKPFGIVLTSTPGNLQTDFGKVSYKYLNDACEFSERFYDMPKKDIKEYIYKNCINGFVRIKFNYRQLGRDEAWFEKQVITLGADWDKIRREVLLEWRKTAGNSPFPSEDLNMLAKLCLTKTGIRTVVINKYYEMTLFEQLEVEYPMMIGVDVSTGIGKDSSTIVLISSKTKRIIGIMHNNRIDTEDLADCIYTIATTIAPTAPICIERNNVGSTVISRLLKKPNMASRLYRENNLDELKVKMKDGMVEETTSSAANYGIWTDENKRYQMHEILVRYVKNYKERITPQPFVEELKGLQIVTKNGKEKIDHSPDTHDDIIMGYLMAIWALYYGNNIQSYGIIRFPDPAPGQSEEEMLMEEYNRKIEQQKEEKMFLQTMGYTEAMSQPTTYSMRDYYEGIHTEMNARLDNSYNDSATDNNIYNTVNIDPYEETFEEDNSMDFSNYVDY